MYEELINRKVKVVLSVEIYEGRPIIFQGDLVSEGEDFIKVLDKYSQMQFIRKDQIATLGEWKG